VDAFDGRSVGLATVACIGKRVEEDGDSLRRLGMAERRVQARERRMAQDVDRRKASAGLSRSRCDCARPTRYQRSGAFASTSRFYGVAVVTLSAPSRIPRARISRICST